MAADSVLSAATAPDVVLFGLWIHKKPMDPKRMYQSYGQMLDCQWCLPMDETRMDSSVRTEGGGSINACFLCGNTRVPCTYSTLRRE